VDDHVVPDLHVVPERELHVLERLEVLAAPLEDLLREDPPQLHAQLHVLASGHRAVERVPEPEERLHGLELRVVAVGVELGFQGDVAWVQRRQGEARSHRNLLIGHRLFPIPRILGERQLGERLAAEEGTLFGDTGIGAGAGLLEPVGDALQPRVRERGVADRRQLSKWQ